MSVYHPGSLSFHLLLVPSPHSFNLFPARSSTSLEFFLDASKSLVPTILIGCFVVLCTFELKDSPPLSTFSPVSTWFFCLVGFDGFDDVGYSTTAFRRRARILS